MKGAITVLQAVLIFAIGVSLVTVAIPWLSNTLERSLDIGEMSTIKDQMALCNDKLVETARTGTSNKCIFSSNRGSARAEKDGIYYRLITTAEICDEHSWGDVDKERHLESSCEVSSGVHTYELRWRWPSEVTMEGMSFAGNMYKEGGAKEDIDFDEQVTFRTITVIVEFDYTPGQAGKTFEISRLALQEDKAILSVNIM